MKNPLVFTLLAIFLFGFSSTSFATSDSGFIYGKVTTFLGETYIGQIRWGKEEAFWTDRFNASKIYNDNIDYLSDEEIMQLKKEKREIQDQSNIFKDSYNLHNDKSEYTFIHQFACQFGEIKKINLISWQKAQLEMKDGTRVTVSNNNDYFNDMNSQITIYDAQKGKSELGWIEIDNIEFIQTPQVFKSNIGEPLYGTVYTAQGQFTGFIQWDKDERVTKDELDGYTEKGKFRAAFKDIETIQLHRSGSWVTLKNGYRHYVFGTNDVNGENRGIIVTNDDIGRMTIDWSEFEKIEFGRTHRIKDYQKFAMPKKIRGKVTTKDGKSVIGEIVFDLDETYDFEMLDGESDKVAFEIPFRNIKKITPKGKRNSKVELKNKKEIHLQDSQDVTFQNEGLLVFHEQSAQPVYISWREVEEVVFIN